MSVKKSDYRIFYEQYQTARTAQKRALPFWFRLLSRFEKSRTAQVADSLPPGMFDVLEVGCGDGSFLFQNRQRWKSIQGIDVVDDVIEKAQKRDYGCPAHFSLFDCSREELTLPPESFDIVVSIATLQHMSDLALFFSNAQRVLRPGGFILFEVPNALAFWRRWSLLFGRLPKTSLFTNGWDAGVLHLFSAADTRDFCQNQGLLVRRIRSAGIFSGLREWWPGLLGGDLIFICQKPQKS